MSAHTSSSLMRSTLRGLHDGHDRDSINAHHRDGVNRESWLLKGLNSGGRVVGEGLEVRWQVLQAVSTKKLIPARELSLL